MLPIDVISSSNLMNSFFLFYFDKLLGAYSVTTSLCAKWTCSTNFSALLPSSSSSSVLFDIIMMSPLLLPHLLLLVCKFARTACGILPVILIDATSSFDKFIYYDDFIDFCLVLCAIAR